MKTHQTKSRFAVAGRSLLGAGILPLLAFSLSAPDSQAGIEARRIATGFNTPLYVCAPPGDNTRIFVAEQHGLIKIINLSSNKVNPRPFLDLTGQVGQGQGPGILGMTFDPDYATNGHFYVCWTSEDGGAFGVGTSYVSRYTVSNNPNIADPGSEVRIISEDQTQTDHNWDWIGFSPRAGDEGNLYICAGDGGGLNDHASNHQKPDGNAQSKEVLLGKIIRIHIEADGTYTIPPDNPFFGAAPPVRQEIWNLGLRNPFRASFDPNTGNMFIGDVGETEREEVDVQRPTNPGGGENWGWRYREGLIQNPFYENHLPPPDAMDPVLDYAHDTTGICIIGGYVYRGKAVRDLKGLYVFGDCFGPNTGDFTGRIFTMRYHNGVAEDFTDITSDLFPTRVGGFTLSGVTSLGEDSRGELYITTLGGDVFKIQRSQE